MRDTRRPRRRHLLVPALLLLLGVAGCATGDAGAGETAPAPAPDGADPAPTPAPPTQEPPAQGPPAQGPPAQGPAQERIDTSDITVSLVDVAFEPDRLALAAGEPVRLTVRNDGELEHDFDLPEADLHLHTFPGDEQSATLILDEPGEYEARCLIPGHADAGMVMDVVVE